MNEKTAETAEQTPHEPEAKSDWTPPTVRVLGDTASLTQAAANATDDGQVGLS